MKKFILMGLGTVGVLMLAGVAFLYFTDGGLSTKLFANGDLNAVEKEPRSEFLGIWALAVKETAEPTPEAEEIKEARKRPNFMEMSEAIGISKGTGGDNTKTDGGHLTALQSAQSTLEAAVTAAAKVANDDSKAGREIAALVTAIEAYNKAWEKNYPQLDKNGKDSAENGLNKLKDTVKRSNMTFGHGAFSRFLGSKGQDGLKDKLNSAIDKLQALK